MVIAIAGPILENPEHWLFPPLKSHFYFHILEVSENKVHILWTLFYNV